MKQLSIGIVCYPSVGGSGVVATNLGHELAARGHQVHFISYEEPFKLDGTEPNIFFHKVNINTYELFKYPDYTLPLAVMIGAVHEAYHLDVLHVHYAVPHATAALLARQMIVNYQIKPPKIITTLHGTDITLLARDPNLYDIIKYSIEQSDGVTAVSHSLKQETCKVLASKKPIEVIYDFYNPKRPNHSRRNVRHKLHLKPNAVVAIHLSNLRPVKRIPDLLQIAAKLKSPEFKLLILGGGEFKPYLPLVKKLKLTQTLIVKQNIRDIENYITAADFGLYTSQTESFGMGILEVMSYGKPVVAPAAGGIVEVVANKRSGFLYQPNHLVPGSRIRSAAYNQQNFARPDGPGGGQAGPSFIFGKKNC